MREGDGWKAVELDEVEALPWAPRIVGIAAFTAERAGVALRQLQEPSPTIPEKCTNRTLPSSAVMRRSRRPVPGDGGMPARRTVSERAWRASERASAASEQVRRAGVRPSPGSANAETN